MSSATLRLLYYYPIIFPPTCHHLRHSNLANELIIKLPLTEIWKLYIHRPFNFYSEMAVLDIFKLSFLLSLFSTSNLTSSPGNIAGNAVVFPPTCNRIECPSYDVIDTGDGFEIRRYNSSLWISTQRADDISLVDATRAGFLQLFDYIQGKNDNQQKIEMTAPVITEVQPSDGPFCASSFVVSFYVPKENQANAPSAGHLHLQKWGLTYVAVRQFSGFVKDEDVGEEAAALYASVSDTVWHDAIENSHSEDSATEYIIAQYNSPFEFRNRVNEVWLTFDVEDSLQFEE